ncbi:MAG: alpha/beta hydrolase [Planctomycetota bacterium]|nr:alpha/beta hydrolase [Planctomycetota bacterium]
MGLAIALISGLFVAIALASFASFWVLLHPPRRTTAWAVSRSLPSDPRELPRPRAFERWTFRSRGFELPVWDVVGDDPNGPVIVLTHGWGDSRFTMLARIDAFATLASRVIAWDMPGHGEAPGSCTLGWREAEDLIALLRHLDADDVVLFGYSLGAGVSIVAGAQRDGKFRPLRGVVAEAPYRVAITPARNVHRLANYPQALNLPIAMALAGLRVGAGLGLLERASRGHDGQRRFDRAMWASRLNVPLLVVHGERDAVCPVEDGRQIAGAAARGELALVAGAGHLDMWTQDDTRARAMEAVARFLALTRPGREHSAPPASAVAD